MKTITKSWSISDIVKKQKKYNLSHPLQRSSGQWTAEQKTLLVDSILEEYHIDAITFAESEDTSGDYDVIDGMQRLTTICDFVNDGFALHKCMTTYNKEAYVNKTFSELPEDVQNAFKSRKLDIVIMSDYTADELREVFRRKNNGKPLTKSQKHTVLLNKPLFERINKILAYDATDTNGKKIKNFWNRVVSAAIHKSSDDRTLVLQSLMLIDESDVNANNFDSGFKAEDIEKYIIKFQSYSKEDQDTLLDKVEKASKELSIYLDDLANSKDKDMKKRIKHIKKLTIPMLVAGMSLSLENGGAGSKKYRRRVSALLDFLRDYATTPKAERENYIKECKSTDALTYYNNYNAQATASKEKVKGRWSVFYAMATLSGEESTQEVEAEDIVNESVAGHNTDNNDIDISKFPFLEGATIPRDISDEMTQKEEVGQESSENEAANVLEGIAPIETTEEDDALLAEQIEAYKNGESDGAASADVSEDDEMMKLFNSLPSVELTEISAPEVNTTETEEENE